MGRRTKPGKMGDDERDPENGDDSLSAHRRCNVLFGGSVQLNI